MHNAEVNVLSGQDNRHLCGTVDINLCINNVCDINCHGAIGDQVEITTTYVTSGDQRYDRGACLHVKELEVYALEHPPAGELVSIKYNYTCALNAQCTMYIV